MIPATVRAAWGKMQTMNNKNYGGLLPTCQSTENILPSYDLSKHTENPTALRYNSTSILSMSERKRENTMGFSFQRILLISN